MNMFLKALAVGGAGFVGAVVRWLINLAFRRLNITFPLGTMFINVSGSFFLGWFLTYMMRRDPKYETLTLAIGTGFVGAYTTFSTYMFETNDRFENAAHYQAWANLIGSIVLGMAAVKLGVNLGRAR